MKKKQRSMYASPCLISVEIQLEQGFMQSSSYINGDTTDVNYEAGWGEEVIVDGNQDVVLH